MTVIADGDRAVERIYDGATVAILGCGGGNGEPDLLIAALAARFKREGRPRDLTLVHAAGLGDRAALGMSPLAVPGLVKRVIGGHWGQTPAMSAMAEREEIEAYNLPLGAMYQLHREIGGGRPGLITKTGLGTFVDPRLEGGRMNRRTTEDIVEVTEIAGEEYLFYRSYRIDFALLRGRRADHDGNISMLGEPAYLDALALALAARASGGEVFVQVREIVEPGERLPALTVKIPGIAVDVVVPHPKQWQTYESEDDPVYAGFSHRDLTVAPMALTPRKVIARRAARFMQQGSVVALGVGMPDGIGLVLGEEGVSDAVTGVIETGLVGGAAAPGILFGAAMNFSAMLDSADVIDYFNGGGLDFAALGFAQVDARGDANVSKYNGIVMGSGGFPDISGSARHLILCGTLTAGGLQARVDEGRIVIDREGTVRKLVERVEQITYSGEQALRAGHEMHLVTERAVFELRPAGLTLIEVAPGLDLERDVIGQMEFRPVIDKNLAEMDSALFAPEPVSLREFHARATF